MFAAEVEKVKVTGVGCTRDASRVYRAMRLNPNMTASALSYRLNLDRLSTDAVLTPASVKRQADELRHAEASACEGDMGKEFYDILKSQQGGIKPPKPNVPAPIPQSKTAKTLLVQALSVNVETV